MTGTGDAGWRLRDSVLSLGRPLVMGILNATPDSFSDGGRFRSAGPALARARRMVDEGADLVDVGGESTRPGASQVSVAEEVDRVVPLVRLLKASISVPVSVDTRRAEVARLALEAGADAVNDVSALSDPEMAAVVASHGCGLVLMHMRGTPATMQSMAVYGDVAGEVAEELSERLGRALDAGIEADRIALDPGIGFAKTAEQNLELIARLDVLVRLGHPVLVGASRKAFIGRLLGGIAADERDAGTVGACVVGLARGARIFRVHEVRAARHALDVADAVLRIPAAIGVAT
ncbi:MAG: folP [Gemmatimonadetes bacterium]|nr:folP [Gemmatimonadota bacterium]